MILTSILSSSFALLPFLSFFSFFVLGYSQYLQPEDLRSLINPLRMARQILKKRNTKITLSTVVKEKGDSDKEEKIRVEKRDKLKELGGSLIQLKEILDRILNDELHTYYVLKLFRSEFSHAQQSQLETVFNSIFIELRHPKRINSLIEGIQSEDKEKNFTLEEITEAFGMDEKSIKDRFIDRLEIPDKSFSYKSFLNLSFLKAMYSGGGKKKASFSPDKWDKVNQ